MTDREIDAQAIINRAHEVSIRHYMKALWKMPLLTPGDINWGVLLKRMDRGDYSAWSMAYAWAKHYGGQALKN